MKAFAACLALLAIGAQALSPAAYASGQDPGAAVQKAPGALPPGPGAELVAAHCGSCHSLGLVTQNRGDARHWQKLIRWMQSEHNLWDLGPAEQPILDYLSNNFGAPALAPRRAPLEIRWYDAETSTHGKALENRSDP